jgi:tRNA dimethylallyltransferase
MKHLIVVLGPTASGKTRLGVELASRLNGEVISADSRQVYRGMDIGTGKDLHEYGETPYHLIDIVDPGYEFNLFEFQRHFISAFEEISQRGKLPILVGGSGMYLDSVLRRYRLAAVPENAALRRELAQLGMEELEARLRLVNSTLHNSTDLTDRSRLIRAIEIAEAEDEKGEILPEYRAITFGIRWERSILRERITRRLKDRLDEGMIEEVERLHARGTSWDQLDFYGLEYRYLARYLKGEIGRNDMFQRLNSAIHDFAKKQENWFRRMERQGVEINWLDGTTDPLSGALGLLEGQNRA